MSVSLGGNLKEDNLLDRINELNAVKRRLYDIISLVPSIKRYSSSLLSAFNSLDMASSGLLADIKKGLSVQSLEKSGPQFRKVLADAQKDAVALASAAEGLDALEDLLNRFSKVLRDLQNTMLSELQSADRSMIDILLIKKDGRLLGFPLLDVVEIFKIDPSEQIHYMEGRPAIEYRGHALPVIELAGILTFPSPVVEQKASDRDKAVVIRSEEKLFVVLVDEVLGEQSVVVKPPIDIFKDICGIGGFAVLDDEDIALIISLNGLLEAEGNKVCI